MTLGQSDEGSMKRNEYSIRALDNIPKSQESLTYWTCDIPLMKHFEP